MIGTIRIDRLAEVGRWMDHNDGAIYGSSPWHISEEKHEPSGRVIHFTTKGDAVHVFCPVDGNAGEITIKALSANQLPGRRIASITMLGSEAEVKWSQEADQLTLAFPSEAPGGTIATFRVELLGEGGQSPACHPPKAEWKTGRKARKTNLPDAG